MMMMTVLVLLNETIKTSRRSLLHGASRDDVKAPREKVSRESLAEYSSLDAAQSIPDGMEIYSSLDVVQPIANDVEHCSPLEVVQPIANEVEHYSSLDDVQPISSVVKIVVNNKEESSDAEPTTSGSYSSDSEATSIDKKQLDNVDQSRKNNSNLTVTKSNIFEFGDRTDVSSDSEEEVAKQQLKINRRRSSNRRPRPSMIRPSRASTTRRVEGKETKESEGEKIDEEEPKTQEGSTLKVRERRIGISAEPVRVQSWIDLRKVLMSSGLHEKVPSDSDEVLDEKGNKDVVNMQIPIIRINGIEAPGEQACNSAGDISLQDNANEKLHLQDSINDKNSSSSIAKLSQIVLNLPHNTNAHTITEAQYMPADLKKQYKTVLLSFQTNQYTLSKRLENQVRARNTAESGMDKELSRLASTIRELEQLQTKLPAIENICHLLYTHVDILRRHAMKISAQSEQHGCYQQEKLSTQSIKKMIEYAESARKHINKLEEDQDVPRSNLLEDDENNTLDEYISSHDETKTQNSKKISFRGVSRAIIAIKGLTKNLLKGGDDIIPLSELTAKNVDFKEVEEVITPGNNTMISAPFNLHTCSYSKVIRALCLSIFAILFLLLLWTRSFLQEGME